MVRSSRYRILLIIFLVLATGTVIVKLLYGSMSARREAWPELAGPDGGVGVPVRIDPLTGLHLSQAGKPEYFAVVVENSPAARPQRGLAAASVVYEMLTEGGITRFLAFYSGRSSVPIGPVRSLRSYIIDIASQHGTVLAYCGGSPDALRTVAELNYPSIDEFAEERAFYRDNARRAPHNLYTRAESILQCAQEMGYRAEFAESGYVFKERVAPEQSSRSEITISYSPGYSVKWEYDSVSNSYLRSIVQKPHVDFNTGRQIEAKNVILEVIAAEVIDDEGRLSMELAGRGEAVIFSGGQVTRGQWVRLSARSEPAIYVTEAGGRIELCPGNTWVQMVPARTAVKINSG